MGIFETPVFCQTKKTARLFNEIKGKFVHYKNSKEYFLYEVMSGLHCFFGWIYFVVT